MLSAKQDGIKHHFLSLWYNSTRIEHQVSQTINKHSTHKANHIFVMVYAYLYIHKLVKF